MFEINTLDAVSLWNEIRVSKVTAINVSNVILRVGSFFRKRVTLRVGSVFLDTSNTGVVVKHWQ